MAEASEEWNGWMDNPLALDQVEGATFEEPTVYQMQIKSADMWMPFNTVRTDRDEVTTVQAFHLTKHPTEPGIRVWEKTVSWRLVEVPGDGDGQTPHAEILARNEEIKQRRLAEKTQQPSE